MQLLVEAGLPPGVINLVYGPGATIGDAALASEHLAGVHFTGSTGRLQLDVEDDRPNVARHYRNYPRIVGETGGKDFIVAHPSADVDAVATAIVRGSFEYQGQKCSAASRVYAPANLWPELRERLAEEVAQIKMGDVADFENFMGAVIDAKSLETQKEAIDEARSHDETEVLVGGGVNDDEGFFVEPTVIETRDPDFRLLRDELFGPVVTAYVYPEGKWSDTLELVDRTAPYGLDGRRLRRRPSGPVEAQDALRYAAGQLLRERQADRSGRRTAALRRRARVGHERQGRLDVEPDPLGEPADDQGDVRPADGLPLPVHGARPRRERRHAVTGGLRFPRRAQAQH